MSRKQSRLSLFSLLIVVLLAGCTSFVPESPPVDEPLGTVRIVVDYAELTEADWAVQRVTVHFTHTPSGHIMEEELDLDDGQASLRVAAAPGDWSGTVTLYTADGVHAARDVSYAVRDDGTTTVQLVARPAGDEIALQSADDDEQPVEPVITREIRYIQSGSRRETRTEVYVIRSSVPGPTIMLVGGVHGSETSGWQVAGEVAETWDIDRGTLVVIPHMNKDAVTSQRRTDRRGFDLNRKFPPNRDINRPTDWLLAHHIWNIVLEFEPEALLDLHEGWGLREANDRFPGGTLSVGQTLIVYPAEDAVQFADHVIDVLNTHHNPFYGKNGLTYNFRPIGPPIEGSLAYKAGNDLGIPAFIAEPTQGRADRFATTVAQRRAWHRVIAEEFLRWYGVLD